MVARIILGSICILGMLSQIRMTLVYLGVVQSSLGIVGSPWLVFVASRGVIVNAFRAGLCFGISWPLLLLVLSSTLLIMPITDALAYLGVFGKAIQNAASPLRYPASVIINNAAMWIGFFGLLTFALWYFFVR